MSELRQPEADLQAPVQAQGPVEAQLFGAAGEEAASPSSSSSSSVAPSFSAYAESLPQEALTVLKSDLVAFLLLKYRTKEPISKAEMLNMVLRDHRDHFPVVFSRASKCMQLVFGVDVKEVDPRERTYVLVPTLGLTCDAVLSDGQRPKAGLLVMVLGLIALYGDHAPEEEVWELLSIIGVYAGKQHCIYGEPRELLTKVWVQEGYLEYRQVPHSDPARYKFLWGPRAHAETSKWQVLEHLLRVSTVGPTSAEGVSDEEEGA
ncbi:melanoma-associated antigen 10-like [Balaenoptera ricei]|uniref:melanoma-associated antigen 10-like n=1 Tax=Balaenoptera ricei TaxID=2746895 RepID=UPI0028BD7FA0|nr:melanoma-associated antigen 10-like [Balaenoptera ricei]XP_059767333.1 melanoma-associated antigen 10-like [Balaenoptera ricei]XP_059767334.1 melanoma-associated antigen 10-like [Balaenoptera ricei]